MKKSAIGRRLDAGDRQAWVDPGYVQQRLGLHVQNRRILGRVRDLQDPFAPIFGTQSEVLIALAVKRLSDRLDAKGLLCERFGLPGRKRRGLCLQDRFGFGSGLRSGGGRHDFNLLSGEECDAI